jgi:hypothetical protein
MTSTNKQQQSPPHRSGTTLVEVLVAIFVMAIGCLAILAMFPIGALNMTRSIKNDRCAHAAANARAIAIAHNIMFDGNLGNLFNNPNVAATHEDAPMDGQSYALFVDPIGSASYANTAGAGLPDKWVAGLPPPIGLLRRVNLSFTTTVQTRLRWCTLLDDINFAANGTPANPTGIPLAAPGSVERAGKYSWAWLLRRPRTGIKSVCEMTVSVYEQRSLSTGIRGGVKEYDYTATWNALRPNVITLLVPSAKAFPLREGGWILDATPVFNPVTKLLTSKSHAKFYRVVNIGDPVGGAGFSTIEVELASNVQNSGDFAANPPRFVVLDGVVEVFECGQVWKAWNI